MAACQLCTESTSADPNRQGDAPGWYAAAQEGQGRIPAAGSVPKGIRKAGSRAAIAGAEVQRLQLFRRKVACGMNGGGMCSLYGAVLKGSQVVLWDVKGMMSPPTPAMGGASRNIMCGPVLISTHFQGFEAAESRRKRFPVRDTANYHLPSHNK